MQLVLFIALKSDLNIIIRVYNLATDSLKPY
jgi:hypothetical protein